MLSDESLLAWVLLVQAGFPLLPGIYLNIHNIQPNPKLRKCVHRVYCNNRTWTRLKRNATKVLPEPDRWGHVSWRQIKSWWSGEVRLRSLRKRCSVFLFFTLFYCAVITGKVWQLQFLKCLTKGMEVTENVLLFRSINLKNSFKGCF